MPYTSAGSVFPAPYTHGLDLSVPAGTAHLAPVEVVLHQVAANAPAVAAVGAAAIVVLRRRYLWAPLRTRSDG